MEGSGLASLKLAALLVTLAGAYGVAMKAETERNGPRFIVLDRHKENCGGMAGFFGCER